MSLLNVKRFVDVNIIRHEVSTVNGSRNSVVAYHSGTYEGELTADEYNNLSSSQKANISTDAQKFAEQYYANGGLKIKFVKTISSLTAQAIIDIGRNYIVWVNTAAKTLGDINDFIDEVEEFTPTTGASLTGINKKIFICELSGAVTSLALHKSDRVAVVTAHTASDESAYANASGCAGFLASYLSKINAYKSDQVWDYMYTTCKYTTTYESTYVTNKEIEDTFYGSCLDNNVIAYSILADKYRSLGGNLLGLSTEDIDVVNEYTRVLLHQTLTDRVLATLTKKLKGQQGIASLYSTISQELNRYVSNGYLTTDKIWTDDDLDITYNSVTYNIIKQGTPLTAGYLVKILPLSALTSEDKAARKTPPIQIILAEQYGIRKIEIDGEII